MTKSQEDVLLRALFTGVDRMRDPLAMTMTAVAAFAIYVLVHLVVLLTLLRAGAPFLLAEVLASVVA